MQYASHEEACEADPRYGDVRELIMSKRIVRVEQIFQRIKKTVIVKAIGVKGDRFDICLRRPGKFKAEHVEKMALLFGISVLRMWYLLYNRPVERIDPASKSKKILA